MDQAIEWKTNDIIPLTPQLRTAARVQMLDQGVSELARVNPAHRARPQWIHRIGLQF